MITVTFLYFCVLFLHLVHLENVIVTFVFFFLGLTKFVVHLFLVLLFGRSHMNNNYFITILYLQYIDQCHILKSVILQSYFYVQKEDNLCYFQL